MIRRISKKGMAISIFWLVFFTTNASSLSVATVVEQPGTMLTLRLAPDDDPQEEIDKQAGKYFDTARDKIKNKDYWRAAVDLIVILDFFPSYSKLDDAVYWLASCLYEMEMYDGADRLYRYLLRDVGKTRWIASALVGLQKSAYRKGDMSQSLKFYKAIEAHYSQTDVINESRYYAVQTYYAEENFDRVLTTNSRISKKSEFSPFGIYTASLTHLKKKVCGMQQRIFSTSSRCRRAHLSSVTLSTQRA